MLQYALAALAGLMLLAFTAPQHPQSAPAPIAQVVVTTSVPAATTPLVRQATKRDSATIVPASAPKPAPTPSKQPPIAPAVSTASVTHSYGTRTKTSGCVANQALPDPDCSPGAILTTDTSVICVSGYTKTVRNVPDSEKQAVFVEYGIPWSEHSNYEVDHIISLELGGSNDISNLYPESYLIQYNAHVKDTFENYLHKQICSGSLPVATAQAEIVTDWLKYYLAWQGGTTTAAPAPAPTPVPQTAAPTHVAPPQDAAFYTSSYYSSKYYYPATCSAWKGLSPKYLVSFPSLGELLSKYPDRALSPQC